MYLPGSKFISERIPNNAKKILRSIRARRQNATVVKEKGKTGRWQKETNDDGLVVFSTMKKEISEHIKFFLITPWMLKGNPFKDL